MKFRLTLFLTIALSMSPFAGFSPSCSSYFTWICNRDEKAVLPEEQHPAETRNSNWPCWFGLTTCPVRSGNRNQKVVLPEEQLPTDTQHHTFKWPCWLGLSTCHVTEEDEDQKTAFHNQRQHINAQYRGYSWFHWLRLSKRPRWIRYRVSKVVTPKDPKQQSPGPRQKVFSLNDTLGHLWDNLAQRYVSWILMDILKHICILNVLEIACGLWRRVKRLRGQKTEPTASDSIISSDLLNQIKAEIDIMGRHMKTILRSHQETHGCQQERKTTQDGGKRKNPSADSTFTAG